MAKTREQLEAELEVALKEMTRAQNRVVRLRNSISKITTATFAAEPMTVERALITYLDDGRTENVDGYKFLQQLTWEGEWKGSGLQFTGGYWTGSQQRCLQLALDYTWDATKLAHLEQLMRDVLPFMSTNNFRTKAQGGCEQMLIGSFDMKVPKVNGQTLKIFDIVEHELSAGGDWNFGVLPDGSAVVFDARRPRSGLEVAGTIAECLEYVRENLWYKGGEVEYDEDYDW